MLNNKYDVCQIWCLSHKQPINTPPEGGKEITLDGSQKGPNDKITHIQ